MAALVSSTAFSGALILVDGVWTWADDGRPEPAAHSVTLITYLPAVIHTSRYRRSVILVHASDIRALDPAVRARVQAIVEKHGRYAMLALPGLDRARSRLRATWTVAADVWREAAMQPFAVGIDHGHEQRVLDRVQAWQQANADAAHVQAAVDRCVRRFYRIETWQPWGLYRDRAARRMGLIEQLIVDRHGAESPAFLRIEAALWEAVDPDLLILGPDDDVLAWALHESMKAG